MAGEHLNRVVARNIRSLVDARAAADARKTTAEKIAGEVTSFLGSMRSVVVHLCVFGGWILLNVNLVPGLRPFDPFPFVALAMFASVEAIFLTTFVLISQNRAARISERRADLDLHISLLAEHEVTRLIQMLDRLLAYHDLAIEADDLDEMKENVRPEAVLSELDEAERDRG